MSKKSNVSKSKKEFVYDEVKLAELLGAISEAFVEFEEFAHKSLSKCRIVDALKARKVSRVLDKMLHEYRKTSLKRSSKPRK